MKQVRNNYAFIDSQNLNLSIRELGWQLDWLRFYRYLHDRFSVTKVYLFIGYISENQALYNFLKNIGYILIFKPTLRLPNERVKGNVDAELVLHAMIEYSNYDQAVIVTGDGDFFCLVEYLLLQNKLHRLIIPNKNRFSSLLRRFHDHISFLSGTQEKLKYRK